MHHWNTYNDDLSELGSDYDLSAAESDDDLSALGSDYDLSTAKSDDGQSTTENRPSADQQPRAPKPTPIWTRLFRSRVARPPSPAHPSSSDVIPIRSERLRENIDDDIMTVKNVKRTGKKSFCYSCLRMTRDCRHKSAAREKKKAQNPG